jgi:hypothetical protein
MAMAGGTGGGARASRRRAAFAAGAVALVAAGAVIVLLSDRTSLPLRLILLVAAGTSAIALVVGYGLGHYADRGRRPGE